MRQRDIAQALDWSASKVLRIENSQVAVATSDIIALANYLSVPQREIEELVALARIARMPSPNKLYQQFLTPEFVEWLEHEEYASKIFQYETKLIPGVLQTFDYAESIVRALIGTSSDERWIRGIVDARMSRARQLTAADGPAISFIIDESVLRRAVGSNSSASDFSVLTAQLIHLKELNTVGRAARGGEIPPALNPNMEIRVVPFSLGAYQAMRGPFEIIEFDEPTEDGMVYFEDPHGDVVIRESNEQTAPYLDMFADMERTATDPADFDLLIGQILALIREGRNGIQASSHGSNNLHLTDS